MSRFYTNIHAKATSSDLVCNAVTKVGLCPAYISNVSHGWTSIYPKLTESQDLDAFRELPVSLSRELMTTTLSALVHESDVLIYVLARDGEMIDEYNSDPGYFGGRSRKPSGGKLEELARVCLPGTADKSLVKFVRKQRVFKKPLSKQELLEIEKDIAVRRDALIERYAKIAQVPRERLGEVMPDLDEMLWYLARDTRREYKPSLRLDADEQAEALGELTGLGEKIMWGYDDLNRDDRPAFLELKIIDSGAVQELP